MLIAGQFKGVRHTLIMNRNPSLQIKMHGKNEGDFTSSALFSEVLSIKNMAEGNVLLFGIEKSR